MIESASHSQLSYLLQNLCSRSKTAAKLTNAHLLPLQKKPDPPKPTPPRSILKKTKPPKHSPRPEPQPVANPPPSSPDDPRPTTDTSTPIDTHAPPKRKATFHCRNCGRDYTLAESADDTCTHHPGEFKLTPPFSHNLTDRTSQANAKSTRPTKSGTSSIRTTWAMPGR